jgi:hypothetical protein
MRIVAKWACVVLLLGSAALSTRCQTVDPHMPLHMGVFR